MCTKGFYMRRDVLHAISGHAQDAFRSLGVMSTDVVWMASGDDEPILLLHTARGWDGMGNNDKC